MSGITEAFDARAIGRALPAPPLLKIVSVSLGSPRRDHAVRLSLLGREVEIERRGTNGSFAAAIAMLRELDGSVAAFGMGGIEFFLSVAERRYVWRDARRLRRAVRQSGIGDGNGVRPILASRAVRALERHLNAEGRTLRNMTALKTTTVARYHLAQELVDAGCRVTFADFVFALQLPLPIRRMATVRALAPIVLPIVTQLPYNWLYALGDAQLAPPVQRWNRLYAAADIIAGDYLQIRTHMPDDLRGKIILTNSTTAADVEELRSRGVHLLVTETPRIDGRSFGSNVVEALLLALLDKPQADVTTADFQLLIERIPLEPAIVCLNPRRS